MEVTEQYIKYLCKKEEEIGTYIHIYTYLFLQKETQKELGYKPENNENG